MRALWLPILLLGALFAPASAHPDSSLIRREIRAHLPQFRACYEAALKKQPALEGKLSTTFTIARSGKVTEATATGMPEVEACVIAELRKLRFPTNTRGDVVIHYPFVFAAR